MPEWATASITRQLHDMYMNYTLMNVCTKEMQKVYGGPLAKRILDNMNLTSSDRLYQRMFIYGVLYDTLVAFAKTHGLEDLVLNKHATAIVLEKVADDNGNIFIEVITINYYYSFFAI